MALRKPQARDCSTLARDTLYNTLVLLQRSSSFRDGKRAHKPLSQRYPSAPQLFHQYHCEDCCIGTTSVSSKCLVCDGKMHLARSPCKNCASASPLTPVEQPQTNSAAAVGSNGGGLLYRNAHAGCYLCQKQPAMRPSFASLADIYGGGGCPAGAAALLHKNATNNCDLRTTASGLKEEKPPPHQQIADAAGALKVGRNWRLPAGTWNCKRCTLLNNANATVCEACESPYSPDFNSNVSPSVIIKVDNWADNEALRHPTQSFVQKPSYRRSFSELPSSRNLNINRRSLGSSEVLQQTNPPKSSTSMTDIQSSQQQHSIAELANRLSGLNRSTSDISKAEGAGTAARTLYTYIGMAEPGGRDKGHVYQNQSVVNAHNNTRYEYDPKKQEAILQALKNNPPTTWSFKERRWTCRQCSFAYNSLTVDHCEVCESLRSQPCTITVTEDHNSTSSVSNPLSFNWRNSIGQVPIATLDQGLEDDFQLLPGDSPTTEDQKWTCKKCTLVNSGLSLTCEVCCGSKLRSLSTSNDMTLRKGEFWTCSKCTLKNPLSNSSCSLCKTEKAGLEVPQVTQSRSPSPHRSSSKRHKNSNRVAVQRSAKTERQEKGMINLKSDQDEISLLPLNDFAKRIKPWVCLLCTFENTKTEIICDMCMNLRVDSANGGGGVGAPPEQPARLSQEELANKHWNYIVRYCRLKKQCYIDESFPPGSSVLYYNPAENKHGPVIKWRRPKDIVVDDCQEKSLLWAVFRRPLPSDISQGSWGKRDPAWTNLKGIWGKRSAAYSDRISQ